MEVNLSKNTLYLRNHMHLWSMYVLNRMQKKNNLMTKLSIVTSWKKTAQTQRGLPHSG